jgi:hypothetical protein
MYLFGKMYLLLRKFENFSHIDSLYSIHAIPKRNLPWPHYSEERNDTSTWTFTYLFYNLLFYLISEQNVHLMLL